MQQMIHGVSGLRQEVQQLRREVRQLQELIRQQNVAVPPRRLKQVDPYATQSRSRQSTIDRTIALKTARFHQLMKDKDFELAEAVALEAFRLAPDNAAVRKMYFNARFARRGVRTKIDDVFNIFSSHSQLLVMKKAMRRIAIADPKIIDIIQFSPQELNIVGLKRGSTTLTVWLEGKKTEPLIYLVNVLSNDGKDDTKRIAEEIRIERELDKTTSLKFQDTPLIDALKEIGQNSNINIVINAMGIEEEGITPKTPINLEVRDVTLRSGLKIMLQPLNLVSVIEDEVLKITSKLRAKGPLVIATYPVDDLLSDQVAGNPLDSLDDIVELIRTKVQPDSWNVVGGSGSVHPYQRTQSLVIRQTKDGHEDVHKLLLELRKLIEEQKKSGRHQKARAK